MILPTEFQNKKYLPPHTIRMGNVNGNFNYDTIARYFFVNNFYFYCIVCREPKASEKLETAMKLIPSRPSGWLESE